MKLSKMTKEKTKKVIQRKRNWSVLFFFFFLSPLYDYSGHPGGSSPFPLGQGEAVKVKLGREKSEQQLKAKFYGKEASGL